MGNSLPLPCPCVCLHDEATGTTAGDRKRRRRKTAAACPSRNVRAARQRHIVPVLDMPPPEEGGGEAAEEEGVKAEETWPDGCRVEPAGHGEDGGVRLKIVMKRKDVAELVARLEQRDAAERQARMEDLSTELAGGNGNGSGGGGVVTMSPCRDAWRPRLSIIPENY